MSRVFARHATRALAVTVVGITTIAAPTSAQAAAPEGERWQELAWVYVSPGLLAAPLAERDIANLRATWQWSVGGGYTFMPLDKLWIIAGGSFEHMLLNPQSALIKGQQFRIQPEARIGSGFDRLFIYGLAGFGLGLNAIKTTEVNDVQVKRTDGGFNLQVGAGAMFNVWDALSIGGELDFDLGWYNASKCDASCGYAIHTLGIKAMVGYQF